VPPPMGAAQSNTDFDRPLRDGQAGRILRGRRRQQSRMFRTRLTWVIVGGVATLLIVAGVDALRSSKNELPAATTTAAMTSPEGAEVTLPRCARGQITISLEVRRRIVVNAVENVGSGPCHLGSVMLGLTMEDRAGKTAWQGALPSALWGDLQSRSQQTVRFPIPNDIPRCHRRDPFLLVATAGDYSDRRRLTGREIGCR
jgi:hypothetical protein